MTDDEPTIRDADFDVRPPRNEESERNLERQEETPEEIAESNSERPLMEVEEENRPPDFPAVF